MVKSTEKENYNLQKRVDNFLDTTKKLKENIVDLKKGQKSADRTAKILEKKTSIDKEKFKEKIQNLELKVSEQARSTEHSPKDNMSTKDSSSVSKVDAMMPTTHFVNPTMPLSVSPLTDKASSTSKKTETKSVQVQTMVSSSSLKTSSTFDENSNVFNLPGPISDTFKTSGKKTGEKKDFKLKKQNWGTTFVPSVRTWGKIFVVLKNIYPGDEHNKVNSVLLELQLGLSLAK